MHTSCGMGFTMDSKMLAEAFDKTPAFGFGLWLLWPIFESILAFSDNSIYVGVEE